MVSPFYIYIFFFSTNTRLFHHANVSEISYTTAIAVYACFFLLLYKPWYLKKFINIINVFPTHKKKKKKKKEKRNRKNVDVTMAYQVLCTNLISKL